MAVMPYIPALVVVAAQVLRALMVKALQAVKLPLETVGMARHLLSLVHL
jgi:hypothetical protein